MLKMDKQWGIAKQSLTKQEQKFYATCDIDEEKIKKYLELYGVFCYTDFDKMLKEKLI